MAKYELNKDNAICKDGHTMFIVDILRTMNDTALLHAEIKNLTKQYENDLRDKDALIVEAFNGGAIGDCTNFETWKEYYNK